MSVKNEIEQLEKELKFLERNPSKDYVVYQALNRSDYIREYLLPDLHERYELGADDDIERDECGDN